MEFENNTLPEQRGFTTEDILWAVGIWSVLLTMSPVVVFYMLMVAYARRFCRPSRHLVMEMVRIATAFADELRRTSRRLRCSQRRRVIFQRKHKEKRAEPARRL